MRIYVYAFMQTDQGNSVIGDYNHSPGSLDRTYHGMTPGHDSTYDNTDLNEQLL